MTAPRILLTNDDGYLAPGLLAAFRAVVELGTVCVVAPRLERSGCSHSITLGEPIVVERFEQEELGNVFAVDGSPADCVRLAAASLMAPPIDLVLSGINRGANAGVDVFYSGTVAAAREGAILGIRSISLSQAVRTGVDVDWSASARAAEVVVRALLRESLPGPGFWSVNFPAPVPDDPQNHLHRVPVATRPVPMQFDRAAEEDGRRMIFTYGASYWAREAAEASDYGVIRDGGIAISAVPLHGAFPGTRSRR